MTLWPDLPGKFRLTVTDQMADFFVRDQVAVRVEQDLGPGYKRYAGWLRVPRTLLEDLRPGEIEKIVEGHLDRVFRPWRYSDRPAFRPFDLFPRLARIERWVRNLPRRVRDWQEERIQAGHR